MKVLFIVPRLDKASTRYRVLQYLPHLGSAGISHQIRSISKRLLTSLPLLRPARNADLVFVQKRLFAPLDLLLLRAFARCLVYDLDDAVMFKDTGAEEQTKMDRRFKFAAMARRADLIIAGNDYLREQTLPYNHRVRLLPTPLDMARYTPREAVRPGNRDIVLGWIGSRGTLQYLRNIAPALEAIGRKHRSVKLKIVADDFFDLEHMNVIKKPWSSQEEIADLHSFDIGLMPLTDDVWSRGKCGFKLLQYMAVGAPVVCSPVGMNREIVDHGLEGFWASTEADWVEKVEQLILDEKTRSRFGEKGREKVIRRYSLSANSPLFVGYLQEAVKSRAR